MPDLPQVPRIADLVGPAIDAMVAARPSILQHINNGAGRYADLVAGWEAQCSIIVRQIADEVASARRAHAKGEALTQLAASEFRTQRNVGAKYAVGRALLTRSTGLLAGGVIPQGFRFAREAVDTAVPPVKAASFVASRDVSFAQGVTSISVPILASLAGEASNAPYYDGDNTAGGAAPLTMIDTPFDRAISISSYEAAGGSDGEDDDDLRRQMGANATGRNGPTLGAIFAGALSGIGVHRAAAFEIVQVNNGGTLQPAAFTVVAVADSSWSSGYGGIPNGSTAGVWENLVAQVIADSFQGVGGQVVVVGVGNVRIRVDATFSLRSADDLKDTAAIDAAVLARAASYFDDRDDWYTWTLGGLRAWLSRAHPKILACTSATVRALSTNTPLSEPVGLPSATPLGIGINHYALVQNGVTPSYVAAS